LTDIPGTIHPSRAQDYRHDCDDLKGAVPISVDALLLLGRGALGLKDAGEVQAERRRRAWGRALPFDGPAVSASPGTFPHRSRRRHYLLYRAIFRTSEIWLELTALSVEVWIDGFEPRDRRLQRGTGLVDIWSIVAALDSRHDVSRDRCENLGGDWQTHWLDRMTDILYYSSQAPLSLGQRAQTVDMRILQDPSHRNSPLGVVPGC
jgi:hypothetical protein